MSRKLRVIILNTDESVSADLRSALLSIDGVRIVAEVDEPAMLIQALDQVPAEILLIHLDPNPAGIMDVVAPLIEQRKEQIASIAMTEDRDAELVMRAMRAGMREFLWKPFPPEQLENVIDRVVSTDPAAQKARIGRLISVVATGGGVGATTTATNLAVEIAQLDNWSGRTGGKPRVAIVDMDFRLGQVAMQLDVQPGYSIAELCDTPEQIDRQMIERAMCKHPTGVHILARPNDFETAETISAGQCAGALSALQEHYDFVIADLPARFDPSARRVFDMADVYLLVLQLTVPAVRAADRILIQLETTGFATNRVRLMCNRHGRESGCLEKSDVEATLKRKIDFVIPDDWKTSSGAVNMGAPLLNHAAKSRLRLAYRDAALELVGGNTQEGEVAPGAEASRKGLLSFLGGGR